MTPIFADAINFPLVLGAGLIVLVPLMAFEVFVEAFLLRKAWRLPYGDLCTFAFFANWWSLLAGIPTKILNAFLYAQLLPEDIPGFFGRYPLAIALGSLIYFAVTVLVEAAYAFRWRRRKQLQISASVIWRGIALANIATYAVLAPLHYYATKPGNQISEFTRDTLWTAEADSRILLPILPPSPSPPLACPRQSHPAAGGVTGAGEGDRAAASRRPASSLLAPGGLTEP